MTLKYNTDNLTFIIDSLCTIGFPHKGGTYAIHKLAYELANLGHYVYMFNDPIHPHENINIISTYKTEYDNNWWGSYQWEPFNYNPYRTISIYTNLTWGNPFNTINNARWFLGHYEEEKWDSQKNDVIYNFGSFEIPEKNQRKLTIFDYHLDKFYNKHSPNRKGFAYLLHKNTPEWGKEFLSNFGATEIPHYNGQKTIEYLLDEFNKYEYLLTFDDKSYYTSIAALCGTKSIILNPNKDILPSEYRENNPIQMCGVAYGMNDLRWAENTIDLVRDNLSELEKRDKQTIYNFVEFWKNKLG